MPRDETDAVPPSLIEDEHSGVIQLALHIGRKHTHNNPRRHHADECIIARECCLDDICDTREIHCLMLRRNAVTQTLVQINCPAALHCIGETQGKACAARSQCKKSRSHDFASRNICENPGA